jgi:EmrB/QacA subfamily drug resistance transporter
VDRRLELPEPSPLPFFERLPSYPWLVVAAVCIGAFMGQADASIVQLAMPAFEDAFDASLDAVSWVAIAYVLAYASFLPAFARLADIAGRKTLYLVGFALFGLASALCALAPDLPSLIGFRVLLGIGGAMLGANSVVIVVAAAGQERRGKALGVQAAAQAIGLSGGPALGGVLIGLSGWRSIFWIAVPCAILGTACAWLLVPKTTKFSLDRRFDVPGALLLAPALATLLLAITEARAWGLSLPLIACALAAPILLGAFVWRETRTPAPLVDLRLFRSAAFSAGSVGVLVSYAMLYAIFFAMSFALIRGYHEPALVAGLRLTAVPVALGLVAPISGGLSEKAPRLIMLTGMGLCAISALALVWLMSGSADGLPAVMAALAAFGVGLGLYIAPNNSATIGAAAPDKSGVAGGLLNLLRVFGSGLGVAAASAALAWRIEVVSGVREHTAHAPEGAVLSAVGCVLLMLVVLAAIGALMAMIRDVPKTGAAQAIPTQLPPGVEAVR